MCTAQKSYVCDMKAPRKQVLTTVLALSLVHVVVIAFFLRGFLLARVELQERSTCGRHKADGVIFEDLCHTEGRKHYDKAVLIIIDALRYDFVEPREVDETNSFTGHMPQLTTAVARGGPSATLVKFVADTPTITLSRLKGILTGGLPTFLDVGQSFSASNLTEDNLLGQWKDKGKKLVVLGDDTWMQLMPSGFEPSSRVYPSFNVKDLHTVDDGVWEHLPGLLGRPDDWDVLVAHYLGVDHAGHTFGVSSPSMVDKLHQMDDQVAEVVMKMVEGAAPGGPYENTLLLVMGDHGQTLGGDHGGGSPEETDSALAVFNLGAYHQRLVETEASDGSDRKTGAGGAQSFTAEVQSSKKRSTSSSKGQYEADLAMESQCADGEGADSLASRCTAEAPAPNGHAERSMGHNFSIDTGSCRADIESGTVGSDQVVVIPQIDLTPTLAAAMGVPIPYGNLGKVDPHLWRVLMEGDTDTDASSAARVFREVLEVNAYQVYQYLSSYAKVASLPARELSACQHLYHRAMELTKKVRNNSTRSHSWRDRSHLSEPPCHLLQHHGTTEDTFSWLNCDSQSCNTSRQTRLWVESKSIDSSEADAFCSLSANMRLLPAEQAGHGSGDEGGRAGEELVIALLLQFLDASLALARRQFTQFSQVYIWAGCAAMLLVVAGQVEWIRRQRICTQPAAGWSLEEVTAVVLSLFHAGCLFSVNFLMGEGILQGRIMAAMMVVLMWTGVRGPAQVTPFYLMALRLRQWVKGMAGSYSLCNDDNDDCDVQSAPDDEDHDDRRVGPQGGGRGERPTGDEHPGSMSILKLERRPEGEVAMAKGSAGQKPEQMWRKVQLLLRSLVPACQPGALTSLVAGIAFLGLTKLSEMTGLIDRSGQDPHDKTQPSYDLMGSEENDRLWHLLGVVLLPVMVILVPIWVYWGGSKGVSGHHRYLLPVALGQYLLISSWWLVQLLLPVDVQSLRHIGLKVAAWAEVECASHGKDPVWYCLGLRKMYRGLCGLVPDVAEGAKTLTGAAARMLVTTLDVPLRLLLPRVVYLLTVMSLIALPLCCLIWRGLLRFAALAVGPQQQPRSPKGCPEHDEGGPFQPTGGGEARSRLDVREVSAGQGKARSEQDRDGGEEECVGQGSHTLAHRLLSDEMHIDKGAGPSALDSMEVFFLGLFLVASAPVTLLLGYKGPLMMAMSVAQLVALLQVLKSHACAGTITRPVVGGVLLAMLGVHGFFRTGHFCEFSGLQYTSSFIGFDDMDWYISGALLMGNTFGMFIATAAALPLLSILSLKWRSRHPGQTDECERGGSAIQTVKESQMTLQGSRRLPPNGVHVAANGVVCHLERPQGLNPSGGCRWDSWEVVHAQKSTLPTASSGGCPPGGSGLVCESHAGSLDVFRQALLGHLLVYNTVRALNLCACMVSGAIQQRHILLWAIFAPKLIFEIFILGVVDVTLFLVALWDMML